MEMWEIVARESVRQTLADYTAGTDGFRLADMAACFAPDGVLTFTGGEPMVGPAAIVEGLGTAVAPKPAGPVPLTHVRHHVSSVRFRSITPERAEVTSYFVVFTDVGVDHWGRYRDVLVPVDGAWRFSARTIAVDGFSEATLMGPAR